MKEHAQIHHISAATKQSYGNKVQWHDGGIVAQAWQDSLSTVDNHAKLLHLTIPSFTFDLTIFLSKQLYYLHTR